MKDSSVWLTPVLALVGSLAGSFASVWVARYAARRNRADKSYEKKQAAYDALFARLVPYPRLPNPENRRTLLDILESFSDHSGPPVFIDGHSASAQEIKEFVDESLALEDDSIERCHSYQTGLRRFINDPKNRLYIHEKVLTIAEEVVDIYKNNLSGHAAKPTAKKHDDIIKYKIGAIQKLMRRALGTDIM